MAYMHKKAWVIHKQRLSELTTGDHSSQTRVTTRQQNKISTYTQNAQTVTGMVDLSSVKV